MRSLPGDREKALAAIANGWGREATTAHPHCLCGKLKRAYCTRDWVFFGRDANGMPEGMEWRWVERRETYLPEDCPMHRPEERRR